jgi:hypothetical protein
VAWSALPTQYWKSQHATILVVVKKLRDLDDDYFPSNVPVYVVRL